MKILLVEPEHPKGWGKYNQYHGLLKIGAWHKKKGDAVSYTKGSDYVNLLFDTPPDIIYIASIFSYWEPYYIKAIEKYRNMFPETEIIFGGIYAINAEERVKKWEGKYGIKVMPRFPEAINEIPDVTLDGSGIASLLTSRGCPNNCSYCSVRKIYEGGWTPRKVEDVIDEIKVQFERKVTEFCLYDDNFLFKAKEHAIPLLKKIVELRENKYFRKILFSIPSGFQASHMTPEIAGLLFKANFKGRLATGVESIDDTVRKSMGRGDWSSGEKLKQCVSYMVEAGYKARDINVFFICGLPYQTVKDMLETAVFIGNVGCYANMQRFTPIPNTVDFERCGLDVMTVDMALTENRKFVSPNAGFTGKDLSDILNFVRWQNAALRYSPVNMYNGYSEVIKTGLRMAVGHINKNLKEGKCG